MLESILLENPLCLNTEQERSCHQISSTSDQKTQWKCVVGGTVSEKANLVFQDHDVRI